MRSAHAVGPNRSSVTHGIGTVTYIPDQSYDLSLQYIDRDFSPSPKIRIE